jgi:hypothetical protein
VFLPKLANTSPSFVESIEIFYSEPKYDKNTTQKIITSRPKNLYELKAKMSKYTPNFVQLLEGGNNFPLPIHLQIKYQTYYNRASYGICSSCVHMPDVGTKFSFFGNSYMISKSKIDVANPGCCLSFYMYLFLPNNQWHLCHFVVMFIAGLIS